MNRILKQLARFIMLGGIWICCAGCGASPIASRPAQSATTPGTTPSLVATPTPSNTTTNQAITIATDHTVYATTDAIQVTVMNQTNSTVFAAPGHASCTILALETFTKGRWQASDNAPCPTQPAQALVQLRPNIPYHGAIRGLALPYHMRPFAAGEYRLVIAYWQTISGAIPSPNDSDSIASPSFTIR